MITQITIFTPEISYFEVGQKIINDKKETDIEVLKIKVWGKTARVYLSDKRILTYKGFNLIYN